MSQSVSLFETRDQTAAAAQSEGVAVSGANTYYSIPISASHAAFFGLQLVWSGTPTGTFTLWATDKNQPSLADDTDWVQDTTFSPTNPAGSASKMRDNVGNGVARFWRIKYVNSGGSGTLKGYATVAQYNRG